MENGAKDLLASSLSVIINEIEVENRAENIQELFGNINVKGFKI